MNGAIGSTRGHSSNAGSQDEQGSPNRLRSLTTLEPVPEVVATLARLLVDARAGNIKAVALAYVLSSRPHIGSASGIAADDPLNAASAHRGGAQSRA